MLLLRIEPKLISQFILRNSVYICVCACVCVCSVFSICMSTITSVRSEQQHFDEASSSSGVVVVVVSLFLNI